jgi:hypothetical protein
MKTRWLVIASLAVVLLSVLTQVAFACPVCGAPNKVTISGPGIDGTLEVKDTNVTGSLGMEQFFGWRDQHRIPIDPPANPGVGYDLIRTWQDLAASDHLRYYPNSSGAGYIFYTRDSLELAKQIDMEYMLDHWFAATTAEDASMHRLFKSINVAPQSSAAAVSTSMNSPVSPIWPIGLIVIAITLIGGVLIFKRRRVRSSIVT